MRWQTKNNLEGALRELTGRKELPRKLMLNLLEIPDIKAVWSYNRPVTEEIINTIAGQLAGNRYYQFPHKTENDVARQLKARMQWKQVEKNLNAPQTARARQSFQKSSRLRGLPSTTTQSGRRPVIPLAI